MAAAYVLRDTAPVRSMKRILVTGASGQIGTDLTRALRQKHGDADVLATGRRAPAAGSAALRAGAFDVLDVTDLAAVDRLLRRHRVDVIYHLAARLSAVSELEPQHAWEVNMGGLYNVLETARAHGSPGVEGASLAWRMPPDRTSTQGAQGLPTRA